MNKNMQIRTAETEDLRDINRLTHELGYSAAFSETDEWLGFVLESDIHEVFVAAIEKKITGWITLEKRVTLETGFRVEISGLIVKEYYRKKGVGSLLIEHAEKWALDQGINKIVVSSNVLRDESHRFYKNNGFVLKKTAHKYEKRL